MGKEPANNTARAKRTAATTARSPIVRAGGHGEVMVAEDVAVARISDKVARVRARDRVVVPVNSKLQQAMSDLDKAVAAKALSNWEIAMIESLIDIRDLQDVIDAMSELQDVIRENVKQALAGGEAKTFKTSIGSATLAKGAETVTIVDEKKIPFAYMISTPDKAKIGKALRVPIDVDGAKLTEGKPSLRISWED